MLWEYNLRTVKRTDFEVHGSEFSKGTYVHAHHRLSATMQNVSIPQKAPPHPCAASLSLPQGSSHCPHVYHGNSVLSALEVHRNGVIQHGLFRVRLLPLSIMPLRLVYVLCVSVIHYNFLKGRVMSQVACCFPSCRVRHNHPPSQ